MGISLSTCNRELTRFGIHTYLRAPGTRFINWPGVRRCPTGRTKSTTGPSQSELDFCLGKEEDFDQVRRIYVDETDYMTGTYHHWLQETNRMVILAKRNSQVALISLHFPSINVPTLMNEVISRMKKSGAEYWEPISLQPDDVRSIFLNRTVIDTVLPGRRIIQGGAVFRPLDSNLDILLKRDVVWVADKKTNTCAVSLGAAPYKDPVGNHVFRIDMFGKDLSAVKSVFLSQLQNLPPLQGNIICLLCVNPSLSHQMWEFCTKVVGLKKGKQYWKEEFVLEGDKFQTFAIL
ncbi:histidine N-acetyltransferase-like isoform X2 [Heptranchias perlo]|uniref:histidine N-acetyltransferase-like isoform X2 n=1 Tax=Heptranchias perlo TaxID=212740 RepID=UPI003559928F